MPKADIPALLTAVLAVLATWGQWGLTVISSTIAILVFVLRAKGLLLPSSLALLALSLLPPYPICVICALLSTPLFDMALKHENKYPWWVYTSTFAITALLAISLNAHQVVYAVVIPLIYVIVIAAYSAVRLGFMRVKVTADRDLTAIAGSPVSYKLKLNAEPPIRCLVELKTPRGVRIKPIKAFFDESLTLNCKACFKLGGVKKPRIRLVLYDMRRLIRLTKIVEHPPITVIPRAKRALEYARKVLRGLGGFEEVSHIREWTPGDLPKLIHWKKSVSQKRLFVKVFLQEAPRVDLLVFSYASNAVKADMLCEVIVYTALDAIMKFGVVRLGLIDRYGVYREVEITRGNFLNAIQDVMSQVENLGIKKALTDPMHHGMFFKAHALRLRLIEEVLKGKGNIAVLGDCLFLSRFKDVFSGHNAILICV